MITKDEKRMAEAYRAFEESEPVKSLIEMHRDGLITVVEMANSIFWEWHNFKLLPENEGIHFDI